MGQKELIAALREEGEARCAKLRAEATEHLAELERRHAGELERMSAEGARERARAEEAVRAFLNAAAEKEARAILLAAEHSLAGRLYDRARHCLGRLRDSGYPGLFASLAAELPSGNWQEIRVNPADTELAAPLFPDAAVVPDAGITGGLLATGEGGGLTVVNTLDKRLERQWPDILPLLFREIGEGS